MGEARSSIVAILKNILKREDIKDSLLELVDSPPSEVTDSLKSEVEAKYE